MPKMKTKSASRKRFKITGTGKIKRHHSHAGHILTKKNAKRKRHLRAADTVSSADAPRVRRLLAR